MPSKKLDCRGGGVRVKRSFRQQPGSSAHFQNCRAENMGARAAMHSAARCLGLGCRIVVGTMQGWHACALNSVNGRCCSGGGLDVHGSIFQEDSSIFVENCTAKSHGTTAANQIAFHVAMQSTLTRLALPNDVWS